MLSRAHGLAIQGIEGRLIQVEVDLAGGLPTYSMVGLPDSRVRESKQRVMAAIRNSGYDFPSGRVTVNLAPGHLRKEGTQLDLPIALGILAASRQVGEPPERTVLLGELALDGRLRPVAGVLPMALQAKASGFEELVVPRENAAEARLTGMRCVGAAALRGVADHLAGRAELSQPDAVGPEPFDPRPSGTGEDFRDVKGQALAKRALELCAAGGHNLLMIGPPGTGKSMLASRLPGILPELTEEESLEVTRVHSVCGLLRGGFRLMRSPPYRAPHHTLTDVALIGGGTSPRPGEISLAHCGVLFLDEIAEFAPQTLEALRQPLERFSVRVSRLKDTGEFPARVILVAAMNPCPCGYLGHPKRACGCTPLQVRRYRSRLSGPLLDRIDLHVEVPPLAFEEWAAGPDGAPGGSPSQAESSSRVRERVGRARGVQRERFGNGPLSLNAQMGPSELRRHCRLAEEGRVILSRAVDRLGLSARSLDRILKVARTAADLEGAEDIRPGHLLEAVGYRILERAREEAL